MDPNPPPWIGGFWLCLALATVRTLFDGTLSGSWTDFNFVFAYFIGRIAVLTQAQQQVWAKGVVWIAAILSMLGLVWSVFVFGGRAKNVALLSLGYGGDGEGGVLTQSFHGSGFSGLREAATMVGPNGFGALCMIALVVWWVYSRIRYRQPWLPRDSSAL